jgi:ABC-2 type transport system ATP-binding protein
MQIIDVKNLTKKYGKFKAVNNTSFSVNDGETFGILGPNGAGKTTTLEMIEGLRSISGGSIIVDGIEVKKNPDQVKKIIGVQLQSSTYFEKLKLSELLNLFASFYKTKIDTKVILEEVELEQKAGSYVNTLSGGQKQRFSIASTLVNNPKIIFLDEPTTGLDPQARRNVWDLVERIRAKGHTIVLTTHYMEEAEKLCDRIAIMDSGKIVALDTPFELIKKYGSGSVISFKSSEDFSKEYLKKLKAVKDVKIDDHYYELTSNDDIETLKEIMNLKNTKKILELAIKPSNLENVFLNLTGKKLRE